MKIDEILLLADTDKIIDTIKKNNAYDWNPAELQDLYDGEHEIKNRLDKIKTDENGNPISSTSVAKLVLKYQKKIVESSVAFLFGVPVSIYKSTEGGDEAFLYLKNSLKKVKFHSQNRELARVLFTQRRAAKLYYIKNPEDTAKRRLGCIVLSNANGEFYPNFDETGDMDAFLRLYTKNALVNGEAKEIPVYELYTATNIKIGEKQDGVWVDVVNAANDFEKIPVVYYQQSAAEWDDVQSLIDRQELSLSELCDTNQYFASPIAKAYGNVSNMPDKSDQGKIIKCDYVVNPQSGQLEKSDVQYLTWDQRPESLNFQFELIEKYIFSFSQTADISFNNMIKNRFGDISGVALKMLLLDPIMKAKNKEELFDENLQRELSVIKSIIGALDVGKRNDLELMELDIQFNSILPDNLTEVINYLSTATGGEAIISQETAVQKNPLVLDKEAEIEKLQAQNNDDAGSFDFNQ